MRRLIFIAVSIVVAAGGAVYFLYGPATIERIVVEFIEEPLLERLGVPLSPTRRLERAGLMAREQQAILWRQMKQIAAELATSDEFQQYLDELAAELENANPEPGTEVFLVKLRLFRTYRQKWRQLSELQRKIEQGIALAQIAKVTDSTEELNELVRQVETEIRILRMETPELIPLPTIVPALTATVDLSSSGAITVTATPE
ncbi:MAG: hypothetical protein RML36_14475 [Anaerolineae bacterium]|nr:hypothetical protein [Anaerolineae bacterium]MDW8100675.1 hypothetical protein [Anaerolineae bacterium]